MRARAGYEGRGIIVHHPIIGGLTRYNPLWVDCKTPPKHLFALINNSQRVFNILSVNTLSENCSGFARPMFWMPTSKKYKFAGKTYSVELMTKSNIYFCRSLVPSRPISGELNAVELGLTQSVVFILNA